jgi:hypothetical protein
MAKYETMAMVKTIAESLDIRREAIESILYLPVEDPGLLLDSSGKDKDTDDTEGEQGEDDPKGSVSSMSRVEKSSLGHGLIVSINPNRVWVENH